METATNFKSKKEVKPEVKETPKKQKMIELVCSGTFRTKNGTDEDCVDFANVKLIVPECSEEFQIQFAQRQFSVWYVTQKTYKQTFRGLIKLRVDLANEAEGDILCLGKDIKEMPWEELQSLALYKKIREIPYYRVGSLHAAKEKAYEMYEAKINGKRIFKTTRDVKRFKDRMVEKEHTSNEIDKMVRDGLNMVVDPNNPRESYVFSKLPALIVRHS